MACFHCAPQEHLFLGKALSSGTFFQPWWGKTCFPGTGIKNVLGFSMPLLPCGRFYSGISHLSWRWHVPMTAVKIRQLTWPHAHLGLQPQWPGDISPLSYLLLENTSLVCLWERGGKGHRDYMHQSPFHPLTIIFNLTGTSRPKESIFFWINRV